MLQQTELAVLLHFIKMQFDLFDGLGGVTHFDAHGVADVSLHQVLDRALDGGGKEQRLAIGRGGRDDFLDGGQEAHVEHAVGLIQNQNPDIAQIDQVAAHEVGQPSGCRDQHLRAVANCPQLRILAQAADGDGGANAGAGRHFGERVVDLHGEFARGAQDDGADACGPRAAWAGRLKYFEDRQDKRERFAGAGLRGCDQVAPGQCGLNGQSLDGGGVDKAVLCQIAPERSGKREFRETFHFLVLRMRIDEPTTGEGRGGCGSTSSRLYCNRFGPGLGVDAA